MPYSAGSGWRASEVNVAFRVPGRSVTTGLNSVCLDLFATTLLEISWPQIAMKGTCRIESKTLSESVAKQSQSVDTSSSWLLLPCRLVTALRTKDQDQTWPPKACSRA